MSKYRRQRLFLGLKSQTGDPESVPHHYGAEFCYLQLHTGYTVRCRISWMFHYSPYDFAVCHICLC